MGEDLEGKIETKKGWPTLPAKTKHLKIHRYKENPDYNNPLYLYDSDSLLY